MDSTISIDILMTLPVQWEIASKPSEAPLESIYDMWSDHFMAEVSLCHGLLDSQVSQELSFHEASSNFLGGILNWDGRREIIAGSKSPL